MKPALYIQFVNFTEIMSRNVDFNRRQAEFALAALMKIPSQFQATVELGLLGYALILCFCDSTAFFVNVRVLTAISDLFLMKQSTTRELAKESSSSSSFVHLPKIPTRQRFTDQDAFKW